MSARSFVATFDQDLNQRIVDFRLAKTDAEKQQIANSYLQLFMAQRPYIDRSRLAQIAAEDQMRLSEQIARIRAREAR